jgi:hypothetical protein
MDTIVHSRTDQISRRRHVSTRAGEPFCRGDDPERSPRHTVVTSPRCPGEPTLQRCRRHSRSLPAKGENDRLWKRVGARAEGPHRSCRPLDRVGSDCARDVRHCRTLTSFERHLPCERILGGEPTDCSSRILSGTSPCPVDTVGRLHHCQRDLLSDKVRRLERAYPCSSHVDDIGWNGSRPRRSRTRRS